MFVLGYSVILLLCCTGSSQINKTLKFLVSCNLVDKYLKCIMIVYIPVFTYFSKSFIKIVSKDEHFCLCDFIPKNKSPRRSSFNKGISSLR